MASSNIKLFDENKGNMLTDTEFNISSQRLNGLQTGVASSQLQNKAMYQASLVAYAIAQIMLQNGLNANDTDAVSAFVANLSSTILQKVYDIATTSEAQAGTATGKWMSPALVKAAFDYRKATTSEAQNATDDTKWMSPALVKAFFNYMEANTSEAQAGTNNTKWMSPALVKAAIDVLAAKAQNILSDGTRTTYGLGSAATPDDAFKVSLSKTVPVGAVFWLATQNVPTGFLLCDGAVVSRNTYSQLFYTIGTTFGAGDGSTTFQLPDLRAKFIRGAGSSNDYSATFGQTQMATSIRNWLIAGGSIQIANGDKATDFNSDYERSNEYAGNSHNTSLQHVRPYNIALTPIIKY